MPDYPEGEAWALPITGTYLGRLYAIAWPQGRMYFEGSVGYELVVNPTGMISDQELKKARERSRILARAHARLHRPPPAQFPAIDRPKRRRKRSVGPYGWERPRIEAEESPNDVSCSFDRPYHRGGTDNILEPPANHPLGETYTPDNLGRKTAKHFGADGYWEWIHA